MKKIFFTQLMILSSVLMFVGNPLASSQEVPKNIIVLISDGWGYNQIAATNYYHAADSQLFEKFPVSMTMSTYPATTNKPQEWGVGDFAVGYNSRERWTNPDYINHGYTGSAPAATTMASGVKSAKYAIGVDIDGNDLELITERAIEHGKAAGVVTSVQFSHATPASFSVHNISRNNYAQIANSFYLDTKLSVVMGCGNPYYDDNATMIADPANYKYKYVGGEGSWNNLLAGATTFDSTSVYGNNTVQDIDGDGEPDAWTLITDSLDFVDLASACSEVKRVVGVPHAYQTLQNYRTHGKNGLVFDSLNIGVPTLELMTKGALNILDNNAEGLFLMIEGGAIDWAGHANDIEGLIEEQTDFNNTVDAVIAWVEENGGWDDNLVIVTGDHETGYLTGPDYPEGDQTAEASTMISTFPVVDNGAGVIAGHKWLSGGHTRQLIPFYAKGAGSELYETVADETDFAYGHYIDNSEMGEVMFDLWEPTKPEAKNVIVMISDGWGSNQIDAADYFMGETQQYEAWETQYFMSTYPAMTGKVWEIDNINKWGVGYEPTAAWTDSAYVASNATGSAGAATAMYSGEKSAYYAIGVALDSSVLKSFGERAYELGKSTGVITTVEFMHATPAAMFAHNPNRQAFHDLTKEMLFDSRASVIMGCGAPDYDENGNLLDANNYYGIDSTTWVELNEGDVTNFSETSVNSNSTVQDIDGDNVPDAWTLVRDSADFVKLAAGKTPLRVLGVPKVYSTLQQLRTDESDVAFGDPFTKNVPTLVDMTKAALNVLDNNRNGFSLMVEGGAVDWAGHAKQVDRNIEEQNDFNKSVDAVIAWVEENSSWDETMVIVTGDHECGYLVGSNYSNSDVVGTYDVIDNGAGNMPGAQFLSGNHTNQLIPIYIKGEGEELFDIHADQEDPIRGRYMNNTEIGQAIFDMWADVPNGIPNIHASSLNLMEDTLMALNNEVEELTADKETLESELEDLNDENTSLNDSIADLNSEITSLNDSIVELNDYIIQITSVETESANSLLDIYPTVTSGNLTIKIGTVPATIRLLDISGNLIETKTQYSMEEELDLTFQSAGMYIINVETENDMLNAKIIKK